MVVVRFVDSESESELENDKVIPKSVTGPEPPSDASSELLTLRRSLPLYQVRRRVVNEVASHRVTVLVGETGSGKSTQLPQALLEYDKNQRVVISQPRRVAAMTLAARVAAEDGSELGKFVGYQVRFAAKVSPQTQIRYITDGMLLREFLLDPHLSRYTTVVVDEAHERTVVTDLVLGLLKRLLKRRDDLRVVVMSATIDADRFADFFGEGTCKLFVPGRTFGVERYYLRNAVPNVMEAAAAAVAYVNSGEPEGGDILVFLPGQEEIETVIDLIKSQSDQQPKEAPKMLVLPLYASLPEREQTRALAKAPKGHVRKVILATNIAETSVTIPGVRYIIDSGLVKVRRHRARLGLDSLLPAPISQASAAQRAGRAGREGPGKCFRLYPERVYMDMATQTEPEIARVSVTGAVLFLKCAGIDNVSTFEWVNIPSKGSISNALLQLLALKALDKSGKVTSLGRQMAVLPLEPPMAAVLVNAKELGKEDAELRESIIDVAACLSVQDLLLVPPPDRRQAVTEARATHFPQASQWGDLVLVKLIWDTYRSLARKGASQGELKDWCRMLGIHWHSLRSVGQVRQQLQGYLHVPDVETSETPFANYEGLIKAFLVGYVFNTATALPDRRFQTTLTGQPVSIHPGSALFGQRVPAIMYFEYVWTSREYARLVSPIEVEWLRDAAPHLLGRHVQA